MQVYLIFVITMLVVSIQGSHYSKNNKNNKRRIIKQKQWGDSYSVQNYTQQQQILSTINKISENDQMQNILDQYKPLSLKICNDSVQIDSIQNNTQAIEFQLHSLLSLQQIFPSDDHLQLDLSQSNQYDSLLKQLQILAQSLEAVDLLFQEKQRDKTGLEQQTNNKLNNKLNHMISDVLDSQTISNEQQVLPDLQGEVQNDRSLFNKLFSQIQSLQGRLSKNEQSEEEGDLMEINSQLKGNKRIHINHIQNKLKKQSLFLNNTSNNNATLQDQQNNNETQKVQQIQQNYQFASDINKNFLTQIENIDFDAKKLFDQNYRNKLQKINVENYLNSQIKNLQEIIEDDKKIHKLATQMKNTISESAKLQKYLYNNETMQAQSENRRFKELDLITIQKPQEIKENKVEIEKQLPEVENVPNINHYDEAKFFLNKELY